jgi:hypothetical protein
MHRDAMQTNLHSLSNFHILTCTVTDCGVCSWPWQWFAPERGVCPFFVTSNQSVPLKYILGWSAVVFGACEIIRLFFVVFYVVWAVHKFGFRPDINGKSHAVIETRVFEMISMYSSYRPSIMISYLRCASSTVFSWVKESTCIYKMSTDCNLTVIPITLLLLLTFSSCGQVYIVFLVGKLAFMIWKSRGNNR